VETSDKHLLKDVVASLGGLTLDKPSALLQLREQLYTLLRSEMYIYYSVQHTLQGVEVKTVGGFSEVARRFQQGRQFKEAASRLQSLWPEYNSLHVEPEQQNRVFTLQSASARAPLTRAKSFFTEIAPQFGLDGYDQIRALICDGPALMYWVGGMRRERYSAREVKLLASLVPHLQKRLRLERAVEGAPSLTLLAGILDSFGRAAFLLGPRGTVEACNALGLQRWETDRQGLLQALADSRRSANLAAPFEVTPLTGQEPAGYSLAVQRRAPPSTATQAEAAARRWALTPRQSEVLALLVDGQTNRQIAAYLRCAERTVEIHVTAIFKQAQVDNRATLIANVLTLDV